MPPIEIEIKLDLQNKENFSRLIDYFGIIAEPSRQENHFLDTADRDLSSYGWAMRLRIENKTATLTLKGLTSSEDGGLATRPEIESQLQLSDANEYLKSGIRTSQIPAKFREHLNFLKKSDVLQGMLTFTNYRHRVGWSVENIEAEIELDETHFPDGSKDYELEVELKSKQQYQAIMNGLAELLEKNGIAVISQEKSKFARAIMKSIDMAG